MNESATKAAGKGFIGGFFGCFGVLGAVFVLLILLLVLGQCSASRESDRFAQTGELSPSSARLHCVGPGADRGWEVALADPEPMGSGRFRCLYNDRRGSAQFLTVEVRCTDALAAHCQRVVDESDLDDVAAQSAPKPKSSKWAE